MTKMTCECCGGTINLSSLKCEYCGTQYESDFGYENLRIETYQSPCRIFKAKLAIPHEAMSLMSSDEVSDYTIRNLSRKLAEAIEPMMQLETEFNPAMMHHVITAKVRIVEPDYRF